MRSGSRPPAPTVMAPAVRDSPAADNAQHAGIEQRQHEEQPPNATSRGPADGQRSATDLLLQRLLSAEGSGDPFSIINLCLADHKASQAATASAQRGGQRQRCGQQPCGTATQAAQQQLPSQRSPLPGQHDAGAGGGQRPVTAVSDAENVSSNVRHQRTDSRVLLGEFEAVAREAPAAEQHDVDWELRQRQGDGFQDPPAGLPTIQAESSKHTYIQQWLHAASAVPGINCTEVASSSPGLREVSTRSQSPASSGGAGLAGPWESAPATQADDPAASLAMAGRQGTADDGQHSTTGSQLQLLIYAPGSTSTATTSSSASSVSPCLPLLRGPTQPQPENNTPRSANAGSVQRSLRERPTSSSEQQLLSFSELQHQPNASSSSSSSPKNRPIVRIDTEAPQPSASLEQQETAGPNMAAVPASFAPERQPAYIAAGIQPAESQDSFARDAHHAQRAGSGAGGEAADSLTAGSSSTATASEAGLAADVSASFTDAEISYGDQHWSEQGAMAAAGGIAAVPPAAGRAEHVIDSQHAVGGGVVISGPAPRPSSPPLAQYSPTATLARQRPASPFVPLQRPLSPHAADDKYPTPRSPTHNAAGTDADTACAAEPEHPPAQQAHVAATAAVAADSPASALSYGQGPAPVPAAVPAPVATEQAAAAPAATPGAEDTFIAHSPASSTPTDELLQDAHHSSLGQLQVGSAGSCAADPASPAFDGPAGVGEAGSPVHFPAAEQPHATAGSPPGTPGTAPDHAPDEPCPGTAVVDDDTVVQTGGWIRALPGLHLAIPGVSQHLTKEVSTAEEHVRQYLSSVLAYFWAQRSEAYLRWEEPLGELHCHRSIGGMIESENVLFSSTGP